jgi:NAD+ synthase (glutamine-hydrolysing)
VRQGFVKAAAVTPKIKVADTKYNAELILDMMKEKYQQTINYDREFRL